MFTPLRSAGISILAALSTCTPIETPTTLPPPPPTPVPITMPTSSDGEKEPVPPIPAADAPPATERSSESADLEAISQFEKQVAYHFESNGSSRSYILVDKPLYKPGETIWISTFHLQTRTLEGNTGSNIRYQLVSPKGSVVLEKLVGENNGRATNDFVIPDAAQGGEYLVRVLGPDGTAIERPIIVSAYEAPRIKKKLEFQRKAFGAGDEVTATIEVKRPTGEVLANHALKAAIFLDGQDLPPVLLKTDSSGNGLVRFTLPKEIEMGDGLLTVLVEDGGVTESISKRIPIIVNRMNVKFFPEGGHLVSGLSSRVYLEGTTPLGKPADLEGRILDESGSLVAAFKTYHQGLGRFDFVPQSNHSYTAHITKPEGITIPIPLPPVQPSGCVLTSFDDLDGQLDAIRVGVRCTSTQQVTVSAMARDQLIDAARVNVTPDKSAVVYLEAKDKALVRRQGVARVTVFDSDMTPQSERLVYRHRRSALGVSVKPDKPSYGPRDQVKLEIQTTAPNGSPSPASLGLAVVDDTVLSFADDKNGHLLSRIYLEQEIPEKVEEPNFFFDLTDEKSALSMDLLMGTRGYRYFAWAPVTELNLNLVRNFEADGMGMGREGFRRGKLAVLGAGKGGVMDDAPQPAAPMAMMMPEAEEIPERMPAENAAMKPAGKKNGKPMGELRAAAPPPPAREEAKAKREVAPMPKQREVAGLVAPALDAPAEAQFFRQNEVADLKEQGIMADERQDKDFDRLAKKAAMPVEVAPVRVFPAPTYHTPYDGPRTDFRETLHFVPNVQTDAQGRAEVSFYLSDAVTSFRVVTEGVGAGAVGRRETVLKSSLPFSMSVKLPVEVSAGDQIQMPLTLTNERSEAVTVDLKKDFGPFFVLKNDPATAAITINAGERKSLFFPVEVTGIKGKSQVAFQANQSGLKDEFIREVTVVPVGFPAFIEKSGNLEKRWVETVDLTGATAGSIEAKLRVDPGPISMMLSGLEGMLQQPYGCFEQASSTNYPNVMVMQYLQDHRIADAALQEKSQKLLDDGYQKLTAYETKEKGYEWFGGAPGHEALSAFGLLEFRDMQKVYSSVDPSMVTRTADWLQSRRDGKGGYQRNDRALDSFGAASPEVTNAYITWSLTEAGITNIHPEIEAQAKLAQTTSDAYLLALAANTLFNVPAKAEVARAAVKKLISMQQSDGHWTSSGHSITRSGGLNLEIETTALALLALMDEKSARAQAQSGIEWLVKNRSGFGQWGATQATVLSLRAMIAWSSIARSAQSPGKISLMVNGKRFSEIAYTPDRREPMIFEGFSHLFTAGKNTLELEHTGSQALPFAMAIEYRQLKPSSSEHGAVDVQTVLNRPSMKMGETVRLSATIVNRTDVGQPMTLARIGLPGGLSFQTWQLKELKEKGIIAFYETRAREVILYFRSMEPKERKDISIDLIATIPGRFTGPSSTAYLYYTDEHKRWAPGLVATIEP